MTSHRLSQSADIVLITFALEKLSLNLHELLERRPQQLNPVTGLSIVLFLFIYIYIKKKIFEYKTFFFWKTIISINLLSQI